MTRFVASIFLVAWMSLLQALPITHDYQSAKELARDYDLPIALVFSGSDWSERSKRFQKEILHHPTLDNRVKNRFVFVEIDFPDRNGQSESMIRQNHELQKKYRIKTFPTVVLLDAEGHEITKLVYDTNNPESFADRMVDLALTYEKISERVASSKMHKIKTPELQALYEEASRLQSPYLTHCILEEGVQRDEGTFFQVERYSNLVRNGSHDSQEAKELKKTIQQRDPEDHSGSLLRLALLDAQANDGEPEKAAQCLTGYLETFETKKIPNLPKLHLLIADYFARMGKKDEAKVHQIKAEEGAQ